MRWFRIILFATLASPSLGAGRAGELTFSDGSSLIGRIAVMNGAPLRLHVARSVQAIPLDGVSEIRFSPTREALERAWRFVEAGRTEKEFWGDPYPVRHLEATVVAGGRAQTGHLYTVPLYIEGSNGTRKVVLRAKQRGKGKQTLADLVYPVRLSFERTDAVAVAGIVLPAADRSLSSVLALAAPDLARYTAHSRQREGQIAWELPPILGSRAFVAAREGGRLHVGWPAADPGLKAEIEAVLPEVRDFFDRRTLLAVCAPLDADTIFSLMRMERVKSVVGKRPWRIGVWRWKRGSDGTLMLAGRGFFVRGRMGETPPEVELRPEAWAWDFAAGGAVDRVALLGEAGGGDD